MNLERPFFVKYPEPVAYKKLETKRFKLDEEANENDYDLGDFILTHRNSLISYIIRFGEWMRFWGEKKKYAWWSHAALIVSKEGGIIEALYDGVKDGNISEYKATEYTIVRIHKDLASEEDREEVVKYAKWATGHRYGYLTIISIAFSLIFGGKFSFFIDGQFICSGLVARALERTKVIFDRSPSHIMPADLAFFFKVDPPPQGTSRGKPPS
jgi:uncharacterized protein YycO